MLKNQFKVFELKKVSYYKKIDPKCTIKGIIKNVRGAFFSKRWISFSIQEKKLDV